MSDEEWRPATADEVFSFVKEIVERMDQMGLRGMIQVDHMLCGPGASIALIGQSDRWVKAEVTSKP